MASDSIIKRSVMHNHEQPTARPSRRTVLTAIPTQYYSIGRKCERDFMGLTDNAGIRLRPIRGEEGARIREKPAPPRRCGASPCQTRSPAPSIRPADPAPGEPEDGGCSSANDRRAGADLEPTVVAAAGPINKARHRQNPAPSPSGGQSI